MTYTITVQNQGDVPSGVFSVADQAPFGTSVIAASDNLVTPVTDANGLTVWTDLPSLAPGETTTLDIALLIEDATQAPFTNFSEIISDDAARFGIDPSTGLVQADEDSEPDDNVGIDGDGPTGFQLPNDFINEDFVLADDDLADDEDDHDIEEVDVEIFDLALTKTMAPGSPESFFPGETVTFVVTVFNQGTVPAANVIVEDYVPAGLTPNGFDPTAIVVPGVIPVDGSVDVELDFTVTGDVTGEIVNVAEIIFAQDDLGNTPPDQDSTPDDIEGNDAGGLVDSAADDAIDGDGTGAPGSGDAATDEDDSDPENITVLEFASVGDFVFKTCDEFGVQNGSETPVAGVTVTIDGTDIRGNVFTATLTTGADGSYLFEDLIPGDYQLTFGLPATPSGLASVSYTHLTLPTIYSV